ncbi:hypothetical protein QMG83_06940 [Salinibacterium sp. G-O1]|uniref:hypothetical protein n=1 Tax=Salinibacterium sp. G-O1 TaxID=3046208 RepID=UPI0024BA12BA|nr:hypothetical protein [Salinibacterium sp. G-O1]MDJ0334956.1 hypothetical protein [Salinibacterium sp. G-O1]
MNNGIGFRRGEDRFTIEHILDGDLRVRAFGLTLGGHLYVVASAGPMLEPWWPLLKASRPDSTRPVLSAAAATGKVRMAGMGLEIAVTLMPFPDEFGVLAMYGIADDSTFSDDNITVCISLSLPVIKTALLALSEYRTLLDAATDAEVAQGDQVAPLAGILEVSEELASMVPWQHQP